MNISAIQTKTNIVNETPTDSIQIVMETLTGLLMLFSNILHKLRVLKKNKSYALEKLKEMGGKDWKKSKYAFAIDLYMTTMWKIENCIEKAIKIQHSVCKCGAYVNKSGHLFAQNDKVDLRHQENVHLLRKVEDLPTESEYDTSVIKQRSDKWHIDRKKVMVTGSTMFQALGCDGLKRQKEHYEHVIKGKEPSEATEFQKKAMQHGTDCEIHQIATMSSIILPFLYPDMEFFEEGYYIKDGILVSPDGSIRNSEDSVVFAFEGKAPMESVHRVTLHEEVPVRYIPQTVLESHVLQTDSTLYLCWTESTCCLYKVLANRELVQEMVANVKDTYSKESKCPTRLSQFSKDLKEKLKIHSKDCVLLGEFPSVQGILTDEPETSSMNTSPYQQHVVKPRVMDSYTYDDIQRHLLMGNEVLNECYELHRIMASQVVVYLLSEQPHAIPVMFFYRGYSFNMEVARDLTEKCKERLRAYGLDVVVTAADGEFHQLMVRGRDGRALTQHQLMKDVWKETTPMTKAQILNIFEQNCKPGSPELSLDEGKCVLSISTEKSCLQDIKTPINVWDIMKTQIKTDKEQVIVEQSVNEVSDLEHLEELPRVEVVDDMSGDQNVINANSHDDGGDENPDSTSISTVIKYSLVISEVKTVLQKVNSNKWSDACLDTISSHLQSAEQLKKLNVKELIELTKYVNDTFKPTNMLKTSTLKKHELVNNLSILIADGSKIDAQVRNRKTVVDTLRNLAYKQITKKSYPKKLLHVAYANFIWPNKVSTWLQEARVSSEVVIKGIMPTLKPYYVPDRTKDGDFEVFVYDKTHLGSNLRKCICLNKVKGVSNKAWHRVTRSNPEVLHPLVVEVTEDGRIQDQMKEKYSRNMFSEDVEKCMKVNGDVIEAEFCRIIRDGLYEAEDTPGISAVERCEKRMRLINWLNTDVHFGKFPPYGSTIKGLSTILYEGLRSSTEAKLYLYPLSKKGTYCVRAPNTLCSESFFSSMQEMDPWGHCVLSADGIEKHITDFSTLTALKMNDERSFYINTKRDKKYPVPKVLPVPPVTDTVAECACQCRKKKFIQCIDPRNHFFDTEDRLRGRKSKEKPVTFSGFNQPLKGDQPIRSSYYKVNEAKVLTSKRVGLEF